jgi:hypothetical protein
MSKGRVVTAERDYEPLDAIKARDEALVDGVKPGVDDLVAVI